MTLARRVSTIGGIAALVLVTACGGGTDGASDEAATPETVAPTTTVAETTTTTTTIPPILAPLTGLPVDAPLTRPALVAKIDNHPKARPQWGLNQADIVFEENVEMLTRFAAVFHTNDSDPVGPIRSGRKQDVDLLESLNSPLFVWSGGNAEVTRLIRSSTMVDLSHSSANDAGGYRRESSRSAPHNLIADTSKLWTLAPEGAAPPAAQFAYRAADEAIPSTARETAGIKLSMDGVRVLWEWSTEFGRFLRSQDDKPHVDVDDVRINSANVVVLYVQYSKSGYSPVAKTIGSGEAWVFTAGKLFQGTWERADAGDPFTLKDTAGNEIKLTPGNTWVELPRIGKGASYLPGTDPMSFKYP
ncbi:MAG: DUF3048 domain-containing protein [Ilumatobacteraceae bacterium]